MYKSVATLFKLVATQSQPSEMVLRGLEILLSKIEIELGSNAMRFNGAATLFALVAIET